MSSQNKTAFQEEVFSDGWLERFPSPEKETGALMQGQIKILDRFFDCLLLPKTERAKKSDYRIALKGKRGYRAFGWGRWEQGKETGRDYILLCVQHPDHLPRAAWFSVFADDPEGQPKEADKPMYFTARRNVPTGVAKTAQAEEDEFGLGGDGNPY